MQNYMYSRDDGWHTPPCGQADRTVIKTN